jgi:PIN domain nuclease of toxin-antitoxin system
VSLLLDTQIFVWLVVGDDRLKPSTRIEIRDGECFFSAISIWEIAIKAALKRPDFKVEPPVLRDALLELGWTELPFTGEHAMAVRHLPAIHADPFDRALLAQAVVEGMDLVTADRALIAYGAPARGM